MRADGEIVFIGITIASISIGYATSAVYGWLAFGIGIILMGIFSKWIK